MGYGPPEGGIAMVPTRVGALLVAVGVLVVAGCGVATDSLADKRCRDWAKENATDEHLREVAREEGIPEERFLDLMNEERRQEAMAYDWASCLKEKGWACEPLSPSDPPKVCRGENVQATQPLPQGGATRIS